MNAAFDQDALQQTPLERARVASLLELMPERGRSLLDVGARQGGISQLLAERFDRVVALDLQPIWIRHPRVLAVQGDATALPFRDHQIETVLCAEVLEHIPPAALTRACSEIARVARDTVVIGVPFRQDLRYGRTTCRTCGKANPPWGHVNSFDEGKIRSLFSSMVAERVAFVGETRARTNAVSTRLLDFAGNPYGTYDQLEQCIHCGEAIGGPTSRSLVGRAATRVAFVLNDIQRRFAEVRPNWMHVRFRRRDPDSMLDRSSTSLPGAPQIER